MDDVDIARLYDAEAHEEWSRLDVRRIEFGVTCRVLDEFLPRPPAKILDVGAGPGRYAIRLAKRGYDVSLVDVSERSLHLAVEKGADAGVTFSSVVRANAVDLSTFESGEFDAVLQMGPLYHLKRAESRTTAVHEALRVLRSDGVLVAAHLNRYSVVRYAAKVRPAQLAEAPAFIDSILKHGIGNTADGFLASCYCADPTEIRSFMEGAGSETIAMVGCEGVVAEVEERLNELPEEEFSEWVTLNWELGRRPELVSASAHILHVGRKRTRSFRSAG